MEIIASKLDWLKERKDFNTNPTARATARLLEHQYAGPNLEQPVGGDLYPWISREVRKGNIRLPEGYKHWLQVVEMEMQAEQELARRQDLSDNDPTLGDNTPGYKSWHDDSLPLDWKNIQEAPWNKLTDFVEGMQGGHYGNGEDTPWHKINAMNGGQRFEVATPNNDDGDYATLEPRDLKQWQEVLTDRAKRRKGVDPMQFSAPEFHQKMNNEWAPEYEDQQRQNNGQVIHAYPDKWTIRGPLTVEEAQQEGDDMGHCIGKEEYGYPDKIRQGTTHAFSLRDKRNRPHATFEITPPKSNERAERTEMLNHIQVPWPSEDPELYNRFGVHHDQEHLVRNFVANGMLGYNSEPFGEGAPKQAWQMAQHLLPLQPPLPPKPEPNPQAAPWWGGQLVQVQGKAINGVPNLPPIEEYRQRLRDWFGSIPEEAQPSNLADTTYHPTTPAGGGDSSAYMDDMHHLGRTMEHHPSPAHKGVNGQTCHCPWGPDRDLWSWNEHTSARDGSDLAFQDPAQGWEDDVDDSNPPYIQSFGDVVSMFGGTGLVSNFEETPEAVNISLVDVPEERRGQGTGSRFMQAAKSYCDSAGKQLVVSEVDNPNFFGKFPWLNYQKGQGEARPQFHSNEKVIPHQDLNTPCPTCQTMMVNGHCPQCQWSPSDANIDSDPLSNPPDPTVDMHRGIQARVSTDRSLYHGTLIDHLPSIRDYGLIPDVGEFTSDSYGLNEDGSYDQGDEEPYTAEEMGIRPATYMTDKRDLGKAQTAMTHAIAKKLNKDYHDVTPEDVAQHGLLVKLKGGTPGYGPDETGLNQVTPDNQDTGKHPYTAEPGDWWSEDTVGGNNNGLQFITGPKINQVLNQPAPIPHPQGWSADQGQLFNTKPYYDQSVTQDRQQSYGHITLSHRHQWMAAVDDFD